MRLEVGPFDPALHVRSRDHHRAVCREAALRASARTARPAAGRRPSPASTGTSA
jgi:hypothetical protein